jgi:alkylation response protein AidB-like acyl-CoA dehydrogenase
MQIMELESSLIIRRIDMNFEFTEGQEKLRKEVHDFFMNELPEDYDKDSGGGLNALSEVEKTFWMALQKKAGEKGYLSAGWSKESGGLALSSIEQGIILEEQAYAGVVWPNGAGISLSGPALQLFGTEEQKKRFLPPIARGDQIWYQVFTEPDAGSDEANVHLRAIEDKDDFVLNGQKVFVGLAFKPGYLYTLCRTANTIPKHRGISLLLIPGDLPGITYRPLPCMGNHYRNEVFFDNVRVPKANLLGTLNQGFYHAMSTFEFERGGTSGPARSRRTLEDFVEFCKQEKRNGRPLIKDHEVRKSVAQMTVENEVYRLISWQGQWWFGERKRLGHKPYDLTGFFLKTLNTRHAEVMMNILGIYGQLRKGSKWTKLIGSVERRWQGARSLHGGGTVEIAKMVLAQRGLGLPRASRPTSNKAE